MSATTKVLLVSVALLVVRPVRADKITFADPHFLATQELRLGKPLPFEDLGVGQLVLAYKRRSFAFSVKREIQDAQEKKEAPFAADSRISLHWDAAGHRPSLAYRFTDNGVLHFRGSMHGARVSAIWTF